MTDNELVQEYRKACKLKIDGATVELVNDVLMTLTDDYNINSGVLEHDDVMAFICRYCFDYSIDWSYGINYSDWRNIADVVVEEFNLEVG